MGINGLINMRYFFYFSLQYILIKSSFVLNLKLLSDVLASVRRFTGVPFSSGHVYVCPQNDKKTFIFKLTYQQFTMQIYKKLNSGFNLHVDKTALPRSLNDR